MTIVHIVGFGFKPSVSPEEVQEICDRMLALKDKCLHPTTNKTYVKSGIGGKDCSPEGQQRGVTRVFVMEFDSEEDRDYYLTKDPAHLDFVARVGPLVESVQVNDFVPGVF